MIKLIKNFIELDLSPVIITDANNIRIINEVRYILKSILIIAVNRGYYQSIAIHF